MDNTDFSSCGAKAMTGRGSPAALKELAAIPGRELKSPSKPLPGSRPVLLYFAPSRYRSSSKHVFALR